MSWPFEPLRPLSYDLAVIDFPWLFALRSKKGEAKSAQAHYRCMTDEEIAALPVQDLFTANGLGIFWCTAPMFHRQMDIIIRRFGMRYVTMGVWVKTTKRGHVNMGTGYRLRGSFEPFIVATLGRPPQGAKDIKSVLHAQLRRHSEKPDEIYNIAERMHPLAKRRADVFSRTDRDGWEAFGDEAGKFGKAAA
ncbi:hypothetical protein sos41_31510 [Alphaproteobacteria bacterium SO-S41]|nr:hypothetical protein sos41_31510 [Alphaproteobacteria bacterium SO-S41]